METGINSDDMCKLLHMLGVNRHRQKKQWGFRNYYAAGTKDVESLERLVAAGYCVRGSKYMDANYYHATEQGCKLAGLSKASIKMALEQ